MTCVEPRTLRPAAGPGVRATVMVSDDGWYRATGVLRLVGLAETTRLHPGCLRDGAGLGTGARERGGGSGTG